MIGQAQVEQHDLGPGLGGEPDDGVGVEGGRQDDVVALALERGGDAVGEQLVVLDDQDAGHRDRAGSSI